MQMVEIAGTVTVAKRRYHRPHDVSQIDLRDGLRLIGRGIQDDKQFDLLRASGRRDVPIYFAGDIDILRTKTVSIVGTRDVSAEGARRAWRLGRELAESGFVVMSGLAKGVDTAALKGAMRAGGKVAAVIGTPLTKAYPAENTALQEEIYTEHLLVSPFADGEPVFKSNFPKRNRVMALLSDATVIVEASDTSGTLHQAAECLRQGRWLFVLSSVVLDDTLSWPKKFLGKPKVKVLKETGELIRALEND